MGTAALENRPWKANLAAGAGHLLQETLDFLGSCSALFLNGMSYHTTKISVDEEPGVKLQLSINPRQFLSCVKDSV